ncbi:MAG: hypothetical protein RR554_05810 [Vagococcus sp.]|uniref:alpha/beta hydrolase family protein n=1 Tax=Vagococcus sp. TaxID=1933889 RepID=UPI002FCBBF57
MRLFELLFIVTTVVLLGGITFKLESLKQYKKIILSAEIVVLILSLVVDGYRWQLLPVYVLSFVINLVLLLSKNKTCIKKNSTIKVILKVASTIVVTVAVLAPFYMFPIFNFPVPTGQYKVGTKSIMLTKNKNQLTEKDMMIQFYYPADKESSKKADYSTDIEALRHELARTQGMPNIVTGHLKYIKTHSYLDAKVVSDKKFPLLIFSHGMTLYNRQNTFQLEELASHGYVIAAVNYTKDSANTLFPTKEYVPYEEKELTLDYLDTHNLEWQSDATFVLDTLLNEKNIEFDSVLNQVETEKIGAFGHSYGGATSTHLLIEDARVKAAINMDGGFYGQEIKPGDIKKPFMLMNASDTMRNMQEGTDPLFEECLIRNDHVNQPGVYKLLLPNTDHGSFIDLAGFSPLVAVKDANYKKTFDTINQLSLGFFDKNLKGENQKAVDDYLKERSQIKVDRY